MTQNLPAIYENGVFRPLAPVDLPDHTTVEVTLTFSAPRRSPPERVTLPLVPSSHPGTRTLTAPRVAELLDEDELSS
jgi:hypothetical protein